MTCRPSGRSLLPLAALLALAIVLPSCTPIGSGGRNGSSGHAVTISPNPNTLPNNVSQVYLDVSTSTSSTVCVDVWAADYADLYSVSFTLDFDPAVLQYSTYTIGTALGDASQVKVVVTTQPLHPPSSVVAGITRDVSNPTVGQTGVSSVQQQLLMTICFNTLGSATNTPLTFSGNHVGLDYNNGTVITAANFYSATLTIN